MTKKNFLLYLLLGILLISFYAILSNFHSLLPFMETVKKGVIIPLAAGICIAYIINLASAKVEKLLRKTKLYPKAIRPLSIGIGLFLILAVFILAIAIVIPQFIKAITILAYSVADFIENHNSLEMHLEKYPVLFQIAKSIKDTLINLMQTFSSWLKEEYPSIISHTLSAMLLTIRSIITFFVSLVFGIYFTAGKERILSHLKKLMEITLKEEKREKVIHWARLSNEVFSKYITAQCLEAVILGSICFIGMLIFRLPYAPMISALTCVAALIPIYGALISAIVGAFMIAVVSPWQGIFFLLFIIILQQLEGNLIYPKVVGSTLGLPSVYVFLAVTISGSVFGLAGMLFAVPVCTIIYRLLGERYRKVSIS